MARFKNHFDVTYQVNKDNTAVTAIVKFHNSGSDSRLRDLINAENSLNGQWRMNFFHQNFVGVARLKDGDTCDVEKAKAIARAKALRKANKMVANFAAEVVDSIIAAANDYGQIAAGTYMKAIQYQRDIDKLTGKTEQSNGKDIGNYKYCYYSPF